MRRRYQVTADTTLGVDSVIVESQGKGPVLVLERFQEAFAKDKGLAPEEVELLTIVDMATSTVVWERPAESAPSAEEIRELQEKGLADLERQLDEGLEEIQVGERMVAREAAWAVVTGMRKAFELEARYDNVEITDDGTWLACIQVPIGRFPE